MCHLPGGSEAGSFLWYSSRTDGQTDRLTKGNPISPFRNKLRRGTMKYRDTYFSPQCHALRPFFFALAHELSWINIFYLRRRPDQTFKRPSYGKIWLLGGYIGVTYPFSFKAGSIFNLLFYIFQLDLFKCLNILINSPATRFFHHFGGSKFVGHFTLISHISFQLSCYSQRTSNYLTFQSNMRAYPEKRMYILVYVDIFSEPLIAPGLLWRK